MADSSSPDFVPIRPNPYIVGNPVRSAKMFYGRQAEFGYVRQRFLDSDRGGLLVFCGERRSGKTSILFQILDGRLGSDFVPVLIDMQSMAIDNEVDFLGKIAEEILEALGDEASAISPPDFKSGSRPSASFLDFVQNVLEVLPSKKPILLFDEYELFENKIDAGVLSDDVLHMFSHMMESYSVFLIFTGSEHVEQRQRDYWKILGRSMHRRISYLHKDDALRLIREPVSGRVSYDKGTDKTIYRLTAGHPFYTQAICQSLVDHLNADETSHATDDLVSSVVADIVNNPFPQMIFLWESLEQDEKLLLALLAEALPDQNAFASSEQLTRLMLVRKYPVEISPARAATVLEKLFKQELLLKSDATPPGYAFRVDLWRHWVRRMHTVWQVLREEGVPIRPLRGRRWRVAVPLAVLLVALVAYFVVSGLNRPPPTATATQQPLASIVMRTQSGATIYRDGQVVGIGSSKERIAALREHNMRIAAPGFVDTTFVLTLAAGDSVDLDIQLQPLVGDLTIETEPPGALITVDGEPREERSPLTIRDLPIAAPHRITASLPGFQRAERNVSLRRDTLITLAIDLARQTTDIVLVTVPSGSELMLNGEPKGRTPLTLRQVPVGTHRFTAARVGYLNADTTVAVTTNLGTIELLLRQEPPGFLTVQGDYPAAIYVDQELVARNVQNSGARELVRGMHRIRVVLTTGEAVEDSVEVRTGESVVYDYSQRKVVRRNRAGDS